MREGIMYLHRKIIENPAILIFVCFLALQLFYIYPVFCSILSTSLDSSTLTQAYKPFFRSLTYASIVAFFSVVPAMLIATFLDRVNSNLVPFMALMLLPSLLGSVCIGFAVNSFQWQPDMVANRVLLVTFASIVVIGVWQYLPLCVFVFWLQLNTISRQKKEYVHACKFTYMERLLHIYWPHCYRLSIILCMFVILLGISEQAMSAIILKPSKATETQFIGHWLETVYGEYRNVDSIYAVKCVLALSGIAVIPIILCVLLIPFVVVQIYSILLSCSHRYGLYWATNRNWAVGLSVNFSNILAFGIVLMSVLPFILAIFQSPFNVSLQSFSILSKTAIYSFICSLFVTALAVITSSGLRYSFPRVTANFNFVMIGILLIVLLGRSIPINALTFCALYWHSTLDTNSTVFLHLFWLFGQTILTFPYLLMFCLVLHFEPRLDELEYLKVIRSSFKETLKTSFFMRHKKSYLVVFAFGVSLVWGGDPVTQSVSQNIPSANLEIYTAALGKGANYTYATGYLVPILIWCSAVLLMLGNIVKNKLSTTTL